MKKLLFLVLFLLGFFVFGESVIAACNSWTARSSGNCNASEYDCSNPWIEGISKSDCESQGGCYESVGSGTAISKFCYAPLDDPNITPPTGDCGEIGQSCCGTLDNWVCSEGYVVTDFMDCYCRSEPETTTLEVQECSLNGSSGIETALGCIPTEPKGLISWILKYAVSIGGGIAFLLMVFGGFLLSTSSGNPEKVKQGQEILTSAIVGLLFIIFSVFLLQFIGVDILKIPGFTN